MIERYGMNQYRSRLGASDELSWGKVGVSQPSSDAMMDRVANLREINGALIVEKQLEHHLDGSSTITLMLDGDSFMQGQSELDKADAKFKWLVGLLGARQLVHLGLLSDQDAGIDVHSLEQKDIHEAINQRFDNYLAAINRVMRVKR